MQANSESPLYRRWLEIAGARAGNPALRDEATGRTWTFAELADAAESAPHPPGLLRTDGRGSAFILDVLRCWRDGAVVLPEESPGTTSPDRSALPHGVVHVKATTGTTGTRRLVLFTAAQLAADARQIVATMGLHEDLPNLGVISMAHSYGFSNLVLPLLLHGIPLILAANPLPETLRQMLAARPGVALPAVPALWRAWDQAGVDFAPVRLAISAGADLPLSLEAAVFARAGLKIHNFYGSSECGGIAYDRSEVPRLHSGIAGSALDGVTLALDPENGCLVVRSAAVGTGYINGNHSTLGDGRFCTSDCARVDPDGTVTLLGRDGDAVSVAGVKISPAVVEDALLLDPGVQACVVFGIPSEDPIRVQELVACVNLQMGTDIPDLKARLAALPAAFMPRHWWVRPDLIPDVRGKISRAHWKSHWLESRAPKP